MPAPPPSAGDIRRYWDRDGLTGAIRHVLETSGLDVDALTIEDLAPLDQFHAGALPFTVRLATLGGLTDGMRVLDVGGGLGGPARTLAARFGCRVTVVDLAASYVEAGRMLTTLLRLDDQVDFVVGDGLELPFDAGSYDAVWTQNSGMNIADKARLYAGFRRVLRPGGRLVTQEPVAGPVRPPVYPVMWADDHTTDFLVLPADLQATIERSGFETITFGEVAIARPPAGGGPPPSRTIQGLVMGEDRVARIMRASRQNEHERRVTMIHGVFAANPGRGIPR